MKPLELNPESDHGDITIPRELVFWEASSLTMFEFESKRFDVFNPDVSVIALPSDLDGGIGDDADSVKVDGKSGTGSSRRGRGSISKVCTPAADDSSERFTMVKEKVSDCPDRSPKEQSSNMTNFGSRHGCKRPTVQITVIVRPSGWIPRRSANRGT